MVDKVEPSPALSGLSAKERIAAACLYHQNTEIRNAATFLLVHSKKTVHPLPKGVLHMLQRSLPYSFSDVDAKARSDFLSTLKRLFYRLQSAITRLRRSAAPTKITSGCSESSEHLANHVSFGGWLSRFACSELQPTASYQRHITGLKALDLMLKTDLFAVSKVCHILVFIKLAEEIKINPFNEAVFHLMLDLVVDPFDDVRSYAASFLMCFPKYIFADLWTSAILRSGDGRSILARAEHLMQVTGRADFADGYGRLTHLYVDRTLHEGCGPWVQEGIARSLLDQLECDVQVATIDLVQAVMQAPIHGRLIALR